MQVCIEPGCPVLTASTRCEQHRKAKRRGSDSQRPSASQRGYGAKHRADRAEFFRVFPTCQWEEGCIAPATDLDHIDGDTSNRDWSNYRAYCGYHHKQRTARDQPGGWNDR